MKAAPNHPPAPPLAPGRAFAPWLWASVASTVTALFSLVLIANLPFDEESPLARANLALIDICGGGLAATMFAAISVARDGRLRWFGFVWLFLNLSAAAFAPTTFHYLSRFYSHIVS